MRALRRSSAPLPLAVVAALGLAALARAPEAHATDLTYVSDAELAAEIARRREDIGRTRARIEEAERAEDRALRELTAAQGDLERLETALFARVRVLYRMSRQGGSLRYLLGSTSATSLLKRLGTLERLVRDGLEDRRQCGLRITDAEDNLDAALQEQAAANQMLQALQGILDELEQGRLRRAAPSELTDLAAYR